MERDNLLPLDNVFISIKWDSKAKVGTITSYKGEKIRFFAEDLSSMLVAIAKIQREMNENAKT